MSLSSNLKKAGVKMSKTKEKSGPVWKGPEESGITFSLLSRFLCCRERFRLLVVEGLRPVDTFNHRIEYGNCWHICEEALAGDGDWVTALLIYSRQLCNRYRTQQEQIENWYGICKVAFPLYVEYWSKHPDVTSRTPLLQEQVFDVPYKLPSGRTVKLRGKWDSVDLIGKGKGAGIYLQENKTKSDINEGQLKRQLTFDLQTMMYLVALSDYQWLVGADMKVKQPDILGVRYNVVRRPRHYRGKKETQQEFLDRLRGIIEASPEEFFMRWKVEISPDDVTKFRRQCLNPILEQLCFWWDCQLNWIQGRPATVSADTYPAVHWRHPFGVWNVLDEGGASDLDEYLSSGSELGLQRTTNLFPELS